MRRFIFFLAFSRSTVHPIIVNLALVLLGAALVSNLSAAGLSAGGSTRASNAATLFAHSPSSTQILYDAREIEIQQELLSDGQTTSALALPNEECITFDNGLTLPVVSRFVMLPPAGGIELVIDGLESQEIDGFIPQDFSAFEMEIDQPGQDHLDRQPGLPAGFWPPQPVVVSRPAIMRGHRLAKIDFFPVQYDAARKKIKINETAQISLNYSGEGENILHRPDRPRPSKYIDRMVQSLTLNTEAPSRDIGQKNGAVIYVIGAAQNWDQVRDALQPLLEWRRRMGWQAEFLRVQTPSDAAAVKREIQAAYDNWEIPPEAIVICGDTDGNFPIGFFDMRRGAAFAYESDHLFGLLEGDDILPEASVGRLIYDNIDRLRGIVNKIIQYESSPFIGAGNQVNWQLRGAVTATAARSGRSSIDVCKWSANLLRRNGYNPVNEFFFTANQQEVDPTNFIQQNFNAGINFFIYRGEAYLNGFRAEYIDQLRNDRMLPFVILATCNTGDYGEHLMNTIYWTERMIYLSNGGAIGAVGSAGITSSQYNNIMIGGIMRSIFGLGVKSQGWALMGGKLDLYRNYAGFGDRNHPAVQETENWLVSTYIYNLMGDPATELFTAVPSPLAVRHPETLHRGQTELAVQVIADAEGNPPIAGATVCLYKPGELQSVELTDAEGLAHFIIDGNATLEGVVQLTVTGGNLRPYLADLPIAPIETYLGPVGVTIDDDNDNIANPGEEFTLLVTITNSGDDVPQGEVVLILDSDDPNVYILDGGAFFEQAPQPGGLIEAGFAVGIVGSCPHNHRAVFDLQILVGDVQWNSSIALPVVGARLQYAGVVWEDQMPRTGRPSEFSLLLRNTGGIFCPTVEGLLFSRENTVGVRNARSDFEEIEPGGVGSSSGLFEIEIHRMHIPGSSAELGLALRGENDFADTLFFSVPTDIARLGDPFGPDRYGYICLDDTDTAWFNAPAYNWLEIDPRLGGEGERLELTDHGEEDDTSAIVELPFVFQYYGERFDQITVCTNGWLAMGNQANVISGRNHTIPGGMVLPAMICPFWEDLVTTNVNAICTYYDEEWNVFIVEWNQMRRLVPQGQGSLETFEVVLFDPAFHPSRTGDGEILFQYRTVIDERVCYESWDTPFATVGIGSPDLSDGLEYTYFGRLHPGAAPLVSERAILFTTMSEFDVGAAAGRVIDAATNLPLENVLISTTFGFTTRTDDNGDYFISTIIADSNLVFTASKPGYNDSTLTGIDIAPAETVRVSFGLRHPEFQVSQQFFEAEVDSGDTAIFPFVLSNRGNGPLQWRAETRLRADANVEPWILRHSINVGEILSEDRVQGVAFDGEHFYIASANMAVEQPMFYVFNREDQLIDSFPQFYSQSRYGTKDLAFDGELLWCVDGDSAYGFTREGELRVAFRTMINPGNNIAYDSHNELLWITSTTLLNIAAYDRRGNAIREIRSSNFRKYGMDYWRDDPDGYYLYFIISTGNTDWRIYKMNPANGDTLLVRRMTNPFPNLDVEVNLIGAFVAQNYDPYSSAFLTCFNIPRANGSDRLLVYQLGARKDWMDIEPTAGVVQAGAGQPLNLTLLARGFPDGVFEGELYFQHNAIGMDVAYPFRLLIGVSDINEDETDPTPGRFDIIAVYPNPFNAWTTIEYQVPVDGRIRLAIYNMLGQEVCRLADIDAKAGRHKSLWEASNIPTGLYFCKLEGMQREVIRKVLVLR